MKKRTRHSLLLGMLIVLGLLAGCFRAAAPDVTPTPGPGAQDVQPEEGTPNLTEVAGTAMAHSAEATQAAQQAGGDEATPTETPAEPLPTQTPVPPTPVPPTPVPTTPAPTTPVPTPTSLPTGQVTHVVQRGENLFRIAQRYGTTVAAVASANGIANPALIYVGQVLTISSSGAQPSPQPAGETTYVVQPGDNLFRIALRYNMSHLYLAQYNGIANPSRIHVGQILRIPPR